MIKNPSVIQGQYQTSINQIIELKTVKNGTILPCHLRMTKNLQSGMITTDRKTDLTIPEMKKLFSDSIWNSKTTEYI